MIQKAFLVLLLLAAFAWCQTRTVSLTWTDTANPAGTTYSVYRSNSNCSNPTFALIQSGIAVKTYDDVVTSPGWRCYVVTASYGGDESAYSNAAKARVRPFAPAALTVVVK